MVLSITELGDYHRIVVDEGKNTWKLQFYDSTDAKWKDIMSYLTSDQAVNIDPILKKSCPGVILTGTELGGIQTALYEEGGDTGIRDMKNDINLLKLAENTSLEFDIAVPVIFESPQAGLPADSTGVKFTSQSIILMLMHYAKAAAIEATWTSSNGDSATRIELYDETDAVVISKIEGNAETNKKSAYYDMTEGHVLVVRVNIIAASGTAGATTDVQKAVVYFRVKIA